MRPKSSIGYFGLGAAAVGFAVCIFVYVRVQILQSYPFYVGVFGNQTFLLGVTYTGALEIFAAVAVFGVFLWAYSRAHGEGRARLAKATGKTSIFFGGIVAGIVYVETRLLWGEILPGVHVWQGLTGGGGYPWGTEQVAYNTCFIPSAVHGDCEFLNYNELLLIGLICILGGFMLWYGMPGEYAPPRKKNDSIPIRFAQESSFHEIELGTPIVMRNPDSWIAPNTQKTWMKEESWRLPETQDEGRPYRYVRNFKEAESHPSVSEMEGDELQAFINKVLGARGVDNAVTEAKSG